MKILQLVSNYQEYNRQFNTKYGTINQTWSGVQRNYIADAFNMGHIIAPELAGLGFDAEFVVFNNHSTQKVWAREFLGTEELSLENILIQQLNFYDPEILYILDPTVLTSKFLRHLGRKPKKIIGWRAAPLGNDTDLTEFDLILTSVPDLAGEIVRCGCTNIKLHFPGFRVEMSGLSDTQKINDLVFSGTYGNLHTRRNALLLDISKMLLEIEESFDLKYFLDGRELESAPCGIGMHAHPALYGADMLREYSRSRAVLHVPIDMAGSNCSAMRIYEAIGMGALLCVRDADDLMGQFREEHVVRFSSARDLVEKIMDEKLGNSAESQQKRASAQRYCIENHSMQARAQQFAQLIS